MTDVCLCEYTVHGHCGVVEDGEVQNDPTLALLARMAVSHAEAGADVVAPSDMMDGRVGAIREAPRRGRLRRDSRSCPTRPSTPRPSTARSARPPTRRPQFGDRRGYQMDPANVREALREVVARRRGGRRHRHGEAGARLPRRHPRAWPRPPTAPVAAYNVSGEYAMVKAAAARGWVDEDADDARDPDLDPPRRRRHHPHLPREGLRPPGLSDDRRRRERAARAPGEGGHPRRRVEPRARLQGGGRSAPLRGPGRGRAHLGRGRPRASSTTSAPGGR